MKNNMDRKRIEILKGMTNLVLIILGIVAGFMIFIGIMDRSIYFLIGLIIALVEVIIYYSIAVYCDIALNITHIREDLKELYQIKNNLKS